MKIHKRDLFDEFDEESRNGKEHLTSKVKYDINFKPYIELYLHNKSSKKTITSLVLYYDYVLFERQFRHSEEVIHKIIRPNTTSIIKIVLSDNEIRNYKRPSDFRINGKVHIVNLRYSDGTIDDVLILL